MNALVWSAAVVAVAFIVADVLKDRRRERRIDRECAEFVQTLDQPW